MNRKNILFIMLIFLIVLSNSIVYSAINSEMIINGEAYIRVDKDIRITDVRLSEQTHDAYEIYNSDYSKNTTSMQVSLPSNDSIIEYEVTITNKENSDYELTEIIEESYSNSNIKYELIGLEKNKIIEKQTSYTFKIRFTTTENALENNVILVLKYNFEPLISEWTFEYTGAEQEFTVPTDGDYKIELWGANGGYTSGILSLNRMVYDKLYIYVGQIRQTGSSSDSGLAYNGGGSGDYFNRGYRIRGGNGATDIRLINGSWNNFTSLKSRIMVASGGGTCSGGGECTGGGLIGYTASDYRNGTGATQIAGGVATSPATNGSFGKGGNGYIQDKGTVWTNDGFGAGGGYFGGGGGNGGPAASGANRRGSGGGGSSFISGHAGSVAIAEESTENNIVFRNDSNNIPCNSNISSGYNQSGYNIDYTCSLHYSGLVFTNTIMIDGQGYNWTTTKNEYTEKPISPDTTGNGYAKITLISKK